MPVELDLNDDRSEKIHYDFEDYPILVNKAHLSTYPNFSAPSHWHDSIEIVVVLSGFMNYNVNGKIIPMNPGEGAFVNSRQLHFGYSDEQECEFIFAVIHPILLCSSVAVEKDFVMPLVKNQNAAFLKLEKQNPIHQKVIENLKLMYQAKNSKTAPLEIQSLFAMMWASLFKLLMKENEKPKKQSGDLTILKNIVVFIQQNFSDKLTLNEIAKAGCVGQSKCCKLFNQFFHQTPNEFLTAYRLSKACELLKTSDDSIENIAFSVGFSGASYFAETFKKAFAQSPKEYRKN